MTHTLRLTWREDTWRPARVYAHVATIHDHHATRLTTMTRGAGGTWYSDVSIPDDARCSYVIAPVDENFVATYDPAAGVDTRRRMRAVWSQAVRDPAADGTGMLYPPRHPGESGRIVGPAAGDEPGWTQAEAVDNRGALWQAQVCAGRRVWRYEPAGMTDLLVIFDGVQWARTPLPGALAALAATGTVPTIGVYAIDTSTERETLLGRNGDFADWVTHAIVEPAGVDREHVCVAGQSLGGLAAVDVLLRRPGQVGAAIALSGSFWFPRWGSGAGGSVAVDLREAALRGGHVVDGGEEEPALTAQHRVFLSAGTGEGAGPGDVTTMVEHSQEVARCLRELGVAVGCEETATGHEMAAWEPALTRGLVWVYSAVATG